MTAPELEDALVEFIQQNTYELRYKSNAESIILSAPQVRVGFIPRDEVGSIIPGAISSYPMVIVRAKEGVQSWEHEAITIEVLIGTFDDSLDQQGGRDCLQIIERIKSRIREKSIVRDRFDIHMPLNWETNLKTQRIGNTDYNTFPYYFGEMQLLFHIPVPTSQYDANIGTGDVMEGRYDVPINVPYYGEENV